MTTPLRRCSDANMVWEALASVGRMLSLVVGWRGRGREEGIGLAARTALTFMLHVSLQVSRKPVSMFTTYPCQWKCRCSRPRSVPLLQWNKQTEITYSLQSHGRSLRPRRISGRALECVNCHESLCDASFKLSRACYLVSEEPWSTVPLEALLS